MTRTYHLRSELLQTRHAEQPHAYNDLSLEYVHGLYNACLAVRAQSIEERTAHAHCFGA